MKTRIIPPLAAALALSAVVAAPAHADRPLHGGGFASPYQAQIDARQDRQRERIHRGLDDGSLTRLEFRDLLREQHRIRVMEQEFLADDGRLDRHEFYRLNRALDRASVHIRDERHDARYVAPSRPWRE